MDTPVDAPCCCKSVPPSRCLEPACRRRLPPGPAETSPDPLSVDLSPNWLGWESQNGLGERKRREEGGHEQAARASAPARPAPELLLRSPAQRRYGCSRSSSPSSGLTSSRR